MRTAQWIWQVSCTSCRGWSGPAQSALVSAVHPVGQIVSVMAAGTTRAWRFRVEVFQGSPLGPGVCLYQGVHYMAAVGLGHTGIPSVSNNGVEFAFDMERYSEDAVVPAATQQALVAMLNQQDVVAPRFRVRHVPPKEEYLYITWTSRAGATRAIRHAEYGKA